MWKRRVCARVERVDACVCARRRVRVTVSEKRTLEERDVARTRGGRDEAML